MTSMNQPEIKVGITIAAFVFVTLLALIVRVHLDKRDAANVVSGNPYTRKFHVFVETSTFGKNTLYDFEPIEQLLLRNGFRVVSTGEVLAASSRPWKMWPVFVWVTREQGCTIRVFDRFLQPLMVPFVERRFRRRVTELAEQIRGSVEQKR